MSVKELRVPYRNKDLGNVVTCENLSVSQPLLMRGELHSGFAVVPDTTEYRRWTSFRALTTTRLPGKADSYSKFKVVLPSPESEIYY